MLNPRTNERELAYVVYVDEIKPIPGRDRVECARVGGWTCMVPKGAFRVGDPGIYFEIDSKVPTDKEPFGFCEKYKGHIKTQKFKTPEGQFWSQGLLMAAKDFGWFVAYTDEYNYIYDKEGNSYRPGTDSAFLTNQLGITYYEAEDNKRKGSGPDKYKKMAARHAKLFQKPFIKWLYKKTWGKKVLFLFFGKKKDNEKGFPTHFPYVKKSDEERCENMPWILENKTPFIKTTKIDGTSTLFVLERKKFNKREFYVCSRNVRQLTPDQKTYHSDNVYWSVENKFHIRDFLEKMLEEHPTWNYVALQGETAGVGEDGGKIQGDPHKFGELRFFGYNFIDSEKGRWNSAEARDLVAPYGIEWVPIVDENYILPDDFEEFKLSAEGPCEAPGAPGDREGYVYRNVADPNISFKNVSRKYLLKHNG